MKPLKSFQYIIEIIVHDKLAHITSRSVTTTVQYGLIVRNEGQLARVLRTQIFDQLGYQPS